MSAVPDGADDSAPEAEDGTHTGIHDTPGLAHEDHTPTLANATIHTAVARNARQHLSTAFAVSPGTSGTHDNKAKTAHKAHAATPSDTVCRGGAGATNVSTPDGCLVTHVPYVVVDVVHISDDDTLTCAARRHTESVVSAVHRTGSNTSAS